MAIASEILCALMSLLSWFYDMGIQNHRIAGTTGRKMCKDRTFNIIYRISFVLGIDYGQ